MLTITPIAADRPADAPLIRTVRRRLCVRCHLYPASARPGHKGMCGPCFADDPTRPRCRHCGRAAAGSRPRGLCWSCYYTPGLREKYLPESKFARQGTGLGYHNARLPDAPTVAPAGSEAKIRVMIARAARHEVLFHPDDATCFGGWCAPEGELIGPPTFAAQAWATVPV